MSTTQRVVRKQLAGAEDLLQGVGTVTQTRGTGSYPIHKLDIPIPTYDIAEMQASSAEFMRLYGTDTAYTDYRRNPDGTIGIPSNLGGVWEPMRSSEYLVCGNFATGAYVFSSDCVVALDQQSYNWQGAVPKVVAAGATPATSGGVGAGAWVDRSDVTLRAELNVVVKTHTSVQQMVSDSGLKLNDIVKTIGYYDDWTTYLSDKCNGSNEYIIESSGEHDGGSAIAISNGLYARALFPNGVNVFQFGARFDGASDDTSAIQSCINYLPDWSHLSGFGGVSAVKCIWLKSNLKLSDMSFKSIGNEATDFSVLNIGNDLLTANGYHNSPAAVAAYNNSRDIDVGVHDISLDNIHVDGRRTDKVDFSLRDGGYYGLKIVGYVNKIEVNNSTFNYCGTDGFIIYRGMHIAGTSEVCHASNITFNNVNCKWNRRHGASGDSLEHAMFFACKLTNNGQDINSSSAIGDLGATVGGRKYANGFDLEGYGLGSRVHDVTFMGCVMTGNVRDGLLIYDPVDAADVGFIARSAIKVIGGEYDSGTNNINGDYCISITSSIANRSHGSIYNDVVISGATLNGAVLARAVSNCNMNGNKQTTSNSNIATLDYAVNFRETNNISNKTSVSASNSNYYTDRFLTSSSLWDPGTIAAAGTATIAIPVTGAAYGDLVDVSLSTLNTSINSALVLSAFVVFPQNSVQVSLYNPTATSKTIQSGGTVNLRVRKPL